MSRRLPDDSTVERGAQILLALQRYERADGDHAALLGLLARPEILRGIARCGSAVRGAYSWLLASLEAELPPSVRGRRR